MRWCARLGDLGIPGSGSRSQPCCACWPAWPAVRRAGASLPPPDGQTTRSVAAPTTPSSAGTGLILPDDVQHRATAQTAATPGAAGNAPWPQAPRSAWMNRRYDAPRACGRQAGATRWQGSTPGEFALLKPQGYQWFGADGSMVGCTATSACVGFAADGTIAITSGPDRPAAVYDVRGNYVGNFHSDGLTSPPTPNPPELGVALAKSGVDVTSLVDVGTRRMPFAGGATGDPHLVTTGGVRFTTQLTGQYVARGGDPEHAIQLQFDPMAHRRDVTVVSAVAVGAGSDVVEVDMSGAVSINHEGRAAVAEFQQQTLESEVTVGIWPRDGDRVATVALVWPDGSTVVMSANPALGVSVVAFLPRDPSASGLFGAGSAAASSSDLVGRGGSSQDIEATVTSWQVTRPESLFDVAVAPLVGFPETTATLAHGAVQDADTACRAAGVVQIEDRTACVFDVGLTGDQGFVLGHQMLAIPASAHLPGPAQPGFALADPWRWGRGGRCTARRRDRRRQSRCRPADGIPRHGPRRGCDHPGEPARMRHDQQLRRWAMTSPPDCSIPPGMRCRPGLPFCGHQIVTDLQPGTCTAWSWPGSTGRTSTHVRLQVIPGA